jgi:hypothetical protein
MQEQTYKKGNTIAWLGFLGEVVFRGLSTLAQPDYLPSLIPFAVILFLLQIASLIILIWGAYLVLQSKNRSWGWLLLIAPLSLVGLVILYYLKDKTQASIPTSGM